MQAAMDKVANPGLQDRIQAAAPSELVVMLLEGASGFTDQVVLAIQQRDGQAKARMVNKVSAIIEHLVTMLNFEEGGPVVENLSRIYEYWLRELLDASAKDAQTRLMRISSQMGTLKGSWH